MTAYHRTFSSHTVRLRRIERAIGILLRVFAILYVLVFIGGWATYRYHLRFHEVTVNGVHASDATTVSAIVAEELSSSYLFGWYKRDNPFLYPKQEMSVRMQQTNGWIESVNFIPEQNKLTINVVERKPSYIWCGGVENASTTIEDGMCYFADARGIIFAPAPGYSGYPYIRIVSDIGERIDHPYGTSTLPNGQFSRVIAFSQALNREGYVPLVIEYLGGNDFRFTVNRPWTILWESNSGVEHSLTNLGVAVQAIKTDVSRTAPPKEIDLRFGDKVFYR